MPNQATTFRGARAENFLAVHLNTAQFAEQVTYYPRDGGAPLSIPATVRVRREPRQDETNVYDVELAEITFASDPAGAQGLPNEPRRGDALNRTQFGDPATKGWEYGGRTIRSTSHSWTCEFTRIDLVQAGLVKGL
jgi:hypothetical protein